MKCYLSGPMTGIPEYNSPAFNEAAEVLRRQGYEVFNPAEQFGGDKTLPYTVYMRHDFLNVLSSDLVAVLPGWEQSKGARAEVMVADMVGTPVYFWDELTREFPEALIACELAPAYSKAPEPVREETALQEAQRLVHGDRGADYGHPLDDFAKTAAIWQVILGCDVTPEQVGLCMVGVKISRELNRHKRDNIVDGAGYFETVNLIVEERKRRGAL